MAATQSNLPSSIDNSAGLVDSSTASSAESLVNAPQSDSHSETIMENQNPRHDDLEKGRAGLADTPSPGVKQDPGVVTWDGPDDPENPKNWPDPIKWKYTFAVSFFVFISPVSSAMIAPALEAMAADLNMHAGIESHLSLAIFILAYAVGPIFFGPASELYGRVYLLQASNLWYLAWNLGCGFAQTKEQLFAFRFLAGIGGSAPLALGGGAISDIWSSEQRGKAMALYTLGPILGPVVGPIGGGFIAQYSTWRWTFWSTSAAAVCIQAVGLIWLKESHPGTVLRRKRDRLIRETGNKSLHTAEKVETLPLKLLHAVSRPVRLFITQPIVTCISIYIGYLFGVTYLMVATFPGVWTGWYSESTGIGGLNYVSVAIGPFVGLILNLMFVDRIYRRLKDRNGGEGRPEFRMPSMMFGSVVTTIGLFWYGWSIQGRAHWIMPNIGALIFTAGTISCLQGMQTYIVDSYQTFAASAMAACAILRSLAGFAFPLFASYMYSALGYGWGTSVLAFVSIAIGWTAPLVFWFFGPKLRAMSQYASG